MLVKLRGETGGGAWRGGDFKSKGGRTLSGEQIPMIEGHRDEKVTALDLVIGESRRERVSENGAEIARFQGMSD